MGRDGMQRFSRIKKKKKKKKKFLYEWKQLQNVLKGRLAQSIQLFLFFIKS